MQSKQQSSSMDTTEQFTSESITDWQKSSTDTTATDPTYEEQRIRKLMLEADRLEDEKNLRRENWAPIADMEAEWTKQFREVKSLAQEAIDDIKSRVDLTAEQILEIDAAFAKGMNRIAHHNGIEHE